jgi:hypothetical protein
MYDNTYMYEQSNSMVNECSLLADSLIWNVESVD